MELQDNNINTPIFQNDRLDGRDYDPADVMVPQQQSQQVPYEYPNIPQPVGHSLRIDGEFVKSLYESHEVLREIEDFLRGRVKDAYGKYLNNSKPLMREEGVNILIGILRIHMNKFSSFLTNYGIDSVKRLSKETRMMIGRWLYLNWDKYEIEYSNFDPIVQTIDHSVYGSLMKSLNDGERRHMFQSFRFGEELNQSGEQNKKRGWFF